MMGRVHARRHRNIGPTSQRRTDGPVAVVGRIKTTQHLPRNACAFEGPQRLGDEFLGAAGGVRRSLAQTLTDDHRGGVLRRSSREQGIEPMDPGISVPGSLLLIPVNFHDRVIDINEDEAFPGRCPEQGRRRARLARNREATASSWRTCPKVKDRRKEPNVDGA